MFGFEGQQGWATVHGVAKSRTRLEQLILTHSGLTSRRARGLWEIEAPLLQDTHKIPPAQGPRAEAVI